MIFTNSLLKHVSIPLLLYYCTIFLFFSAVPKEEFCPPSEEEQTTSAPEKRTYLDDLDKGFEKRVRLHSILSLHFILCYFN